MGRGSTQLYAESILEEPLFPTVLLVCLMACTSLGKEGCGHRAAHAPSLPVQHQQTDGLLKHGGVCLDSSAGKSLLFSVLLTPSLPPKDQVQSVQADIQLGKHEAEHSNGSTERIGAALGSKLDI